MLRVILRKVQGGLIISAALLVVLAFQRLHSYDVPVLVGHANHHDDEYSEDGADGPGGLSRELVGHGHAHGRHRIFATNVIEIGLFRFVVPFRWASTTPEDSEAARRGDKDAELPVENGGGKGGGPRDRKTRPRANARPARPTSVQNDRPVENNVRRAASATRGATAIAYAVPISSCPSDDLLLSQGLAVLSRSVHRHSAANPESKSRYGYKMYGLVHPDAEECARDALMGLGYEVVVVSAGRGRQKIRGGDETMETAENKTKEDLTSLYGFGLLDHPIVVQLDPMALVMEPLDQLFDAMLLGVPESGSKDLPVAKTPHGVTKDDERELPDKIGAFLIREVDGRAIHRGFRVFRTSRESFEELSLLANSKNGTWWEALSGNSTAQLQRASPTSKEDVGLFSLYYDRIHPRTSVDLDPCVFSTDGGGACSKSDPARKVMVASLASCPEPWSCPAEYGSDEAGRFCRENHQTWFQLRRELGALAPSEEGGHKKEHFLGYCKSKGYLGYVKFDVPAVSLAAAKLKRWLLRRHL